MSQSKQTTDKNKEIIPTQEEITEKAYRFSIERFPVPTMEITVKNHNIRTESGYAFAMGAEWMKLFLTKHKHK